MPPPAASPGSSASGRDLTVTKDVGKSQDEVGLVSSTQGSPSLRHHEEGESELVAKQSIVLANDVSVNVVEDPPVKESWVKVAQKHTFTKQKFVVDEVDGKGRVVVPKEVFVGAKPLWEDFLIGKFLNNKAPHVGKIHMIVNKIWRLGDKSTMIDVYEVNATTVRFRVRNEAMRRRILNRGMWNIMALPMVVSKWSPFTEEVQPEMKSINLWVILKDIPPTMFTDKGLEFLASAVGKPVKLHPKTDACTSFDEAQILVEADLTKDLPTEYVFTGEEEGELDAVIKYAYPWLPPRCSCCKKWGHLRDTCLAEGAKTAQSSIVENGNDVVVAEKEQEAERTENTSQLVASNGKKETVSGEGTSTDLIALVKDKSSLSASEDDWITPPKNGRSPFLKKSATNLGEISMLTNSYSALSELEDHDEDKKKESDTDQEGVICAQFVGDGRVVLIEEEKEKGVPNEESTVRVLDEHNKISKPTVETLRQSLPRGSKTAHKVIPIASIQARGPPQGKKFPPRN